MVDDVTLIARVAAGDRSALAALYERHAGALLHIARQITGRLQEAEDLVRDVLLEAWRTADSYDASRGSVRTWLAIRMRSRAVDRVRSRWVRSYDGDRELAGQPAGAAPTLERALLRAIVDRLPIETRRAVELAYFAGLPASAIAKRLRIPIGTVKSRLAAALRTMREQLGCVL